MKFKKRVKRRPFKVPKQAKTVLERALTLIEDGEWTQGEYVGEIAADELGFCLLGAVMVGAGGYVIPRGGTIWDVYKEPDSMKVFYRAQWAIEAVLRERVEGRYHPGITTWNDKLTRQRQDVIDVLKVAIEKAE